MLMFTPNLKYWICSASFRRYMMVHLSSHMRTDGPVIRRRDGLRFASLQIMPNTYIRKSGARPRGLWTADNLQDAINAVNAGNMGVNEAALSFNIPKTTLKRRIKSGNTKKSNRLGPDSMLGEEAEEKLANHIKKLQKCGFSPTRLEVREMAYKLAEKLGIKNRFKAEEGRSCVN